MSKSAVLPPHRFRRPFDDHAAVKEFNSEPSMTKQADAEACDINNILRKYAKTGLVTHLANRQPRFGDFSSASDYHQAMNLVLDSQDAFAELPSDIRARFDNDPAKYLAFFEDPSNIDEAVDLGLVTVQDYPGRGTPKMPSAPHSASDGISAGTPPDLGQGSS